MNTKSITLSIGILMASSVFGEGLERNDCKIWNEFVNAQKTGAESLLLDFSFAGYKHGEVGVPEVKHKIFNVCDFGAIATAMNCPFGENLIARLCMSFPCLCPQFISAVQII